MFQLWFLTALAVVCIIMFILNSCCYKISKKNLHEYISYKTEMLLFTLSITVFITNIFLKINGFPEIRDLVLAPFRVITSCTYFIIGMLIQKYFEKVPKIKFSWLLSITIFSIMSVWIMSVVFKIYWASSYYNSPFVILGCCAIFIYVCKACKILNGSIRDIINRLSGYTIGIWVLHPFVFKIVKKILVLLSVEISVYTRIILLPIIIFISIIIAYYAKKIPFIRKYVVF